MTESLKILARHGDCCDCADTLSISQEIAPGVVNSGIMVLIAVALALSGCSSSPDVGDDFVADPGDQSWPPEQQQPVESSAPMSDQAGESDASDHAPAPEARSDTDQPKPDADDSSPSVPAAASEVTEAQIEDFATAYIQVMDLQYAYRQRIERTSASEQQAALQRELESDLQDVIEGHHLTVHEFNAIAELLSHDSSLHERVQSQVDELAGGDR